MIILYCCALETRSSCKSFLLYVYIMYYNTCTSVSVHLHEEWSVNITNYSDCNVNCVVCIDMMLAFYTNTNYIIIISDSHISL